MGKRGAEEGERERLEGQDGRRKGTAAPEVEVQVEEKMAREEPYEVLFVWVQCNHPLTPTQKKKIQKRYG